MSEISQNQSDTIPPPPLTLESIAPHLSPTRRILDAIKGMPPHLQTMIWDAFTAETKRHNEKVMELHRLLDVLVKRALSAEEERNCIKHEFQLLAHEQVRDVSE